MDHHPLLSSNESPFSASYDKAIQEIDSDCDSEMNEEEMSIYCQALHEHDGFGDIPNFRDTSTIGLIGPSYKPYHPRIQVCAEEAIKHYNNENATNYEFIEIVNANEKGAVGLLYYITFQGKHVGTPQEEFPTTTFEARVLSGIKNLIEVDFCRLKGSNSSH